MSARDRDTGAYESPAPDAASLAAYVGRRLGEACGGVELVADRRGSRVYRLEFPTGDIALKLASLGSTTVHLIDFALAQGPHPLPSDVTYRGGMVHFTAPETAAHLLATPDDQPIAIDERAEVYALAAVLHLAWTGLPPTAYTHDQAPWRDKLKDVAQGRQHDLAAIRPWPWPPFENTLRHALTPEPENRIPSMTRFRDALSPPNTST